MSTLALAVLLGAQAQAAGAAHPRAAPPGLSWEEADALGRKLLALDERRKARRDAARETVTVSEGEINSYLNLKARVPDGISRLVVHIESERVAATAVVDVDRLQGKPASASWSPFALASGPVQVALKGRLVSREEGFAAVELEEARLGALPVPAAVVAQLVAAATKGPANPEGIDIFSAFRLPYSMRRVRLVPGRALLDF
jgi:hypothetical protein